MTAFLPFITSGFNLDDRGGTFVSLNYLKDQNDIKMKSPDLITHLNQSKLWVLIMGLALAPLFTFGQSTVAGNDNDGVTKISVRGSGDRSVIHVRKNGNRFEVEYDGYITLSEDDREVVAVSAGGYLKISKNAFGSKRRIVIEADRGGNLIRKYYEGWSQKDYEPNGRAWLAEVLPEIVRSTTLGAEDRVDRIYRQGGMRAFANEVDVLEGDYVKTHYIKLVLCKELSESEISQVIDLMGRQVKSDYYLASLLKDNYQTLLNTPDQVSSFVEAARSISSDHYLTEVLQTVSASTKVSESQIPALLVAASSIQSDHYLSSLLIDLMNERELSGGTLERLLKISEDIQSDHYLSEVLREAIDQDNLSGAAFNQLVSALDEVDSDHYAKEVILALDTENMSESTLVNMLDLLRSNVQSDHYLAESLKHIMREQALQGESYSAFIRAAAGIESDSYAAGVLEDLGQEKRLSDDQLSELLLSSSHIQSDHYLTEVLTSLASQVKNAGDGVQAAYRTAAKEISSETYYGRAMRAVN